MATWRRFRKPFANSEGSSAILSRNSAIPVIRMSVLRIGLSHDDGRVTAHKHVGVQQTADSLHEALF